MKLYNYFISFTDNNTGRFSRRDDERGRYWRKTKGEAEADMKKDVDWCLDGQEHRLVSVKEYGVVEKEFDDKFEIVGKINDCGDYEDYTVMIGITDVTSIAKYKGRKVKVTIEFLE